MLAIASVAANLLVHAIGDFLKNGSYQKGKTIARPHSFNSFNAWKGLETPRYQRMIAHSD